MIFVKKLKTRRNVNITVYICHHINNENQQNNNIKEICQQQQISSHFNNDKETVLQITLPTGCPLFITLHFWA